MKVPSWVQAVANLRQDEELGPGQTIKRLISNDERWPSIKESLMLLGMPDRTCRKSRQEWDRLWPYERL